MPREDPERLLRNIGLRIAELRERGGSTRAQFAERLGVSVRYLARIEGGKQNLTVYRLSWLSNALGVRVIDLLATPAIDAIRVGRPRTRSPGSRKPR